MTIEEIRQKMDAASNEKDKLHYMRVYDYAVKIGHAEKLDEKAQFLLEAEALVHDIACPLCRIKYGNVKGELQEKESEALILTFFSGCNIAEETVKRIAYVVSHHHTVTNVDGLDYQYLLEADFLVNASEQHWSVQTIRNDSFFFVSETGKQFLQEIEQSADLVV